MSVPKALWGTKPDESLLVVGGRWYDEAHIRQLAARALEAAKSAGASYADIRINLGSYLATSTYDGRGDGPGLITSAGVGIRAAFNGYWGFASESTLTPDGVAQLARLAVTRARVAGGNENRPFDFVPAPVEPDGRYETPIGIDPFSVPFRDHEAIVLDAAEAVEQVTGLRRSIGGATYTRTERLFASTEGTSVWQKLYNTSVGGQCMAAVKRSPDTFVTTATNLRAGGYGYEALSNGDLRDQWVAAAEEALRIAALPIRPVEVGRYDLVLDRPAVASFVQRTIAEAFRLNRVRGEFTHHLGSTYASPPLDILGKYRVGSSILNIKCDRSRLHAGATVGWDEEGVKPDEFTLVKDGIAVDYLSTRDTASTIATWYKERGMPLRSHGCAVGTGLVQPSLGIPNLTVEPGRGSATAADLYRDIKRGFYAANGYAGPDQQLINGAGYFWQPVYEIVNGRIVGLAKDFGIHFSTSQFWSRLDALGGANSAGLEQLPLALMSMVDVPSHLGVHCVPALIRQANVVNIGREA